LEPSETLTLEFFWCACVVGKRSVGKLPLVGLIRFVILPSVIS
jgi:hypothetical protein